MYFRGWPVWPMLTVSYFRRSLSLTHHLLGLFKWILALKHCIINPFVMESWKNYCKMPFRRTMKKSHFKTPLPSLFIIYSYPEHRGKSRFATFFIFFLSALMFFSFSIKVKSSLMWTSVTCRNIIIFVFGY